jgi:hypothetical protein
MPNMNTYFQVQGGWARGQNYDMTEARRLLLLLLNPIDGEFIREVAGYFWKGYGYDRQ